MTALLDCALTRTTDEPSRSITSPTTSKTDKSESCMYLSRPFLLSWVSPLTSRPLLAAPAPAASISGGEVRTPGRRGPRGTRKISAQATRLEAVDDTVDPLGPLGEAPSENSATPTDEAPAPPQKETIAGRSPPPPTTFPPAFGGTGLVESGNLEEDGAGFRGPPPVQPPSEAEGPKRQTQPSVSIEQAAKPTFDISVGDPHKVGDLTSSHIVYQVRTKVWRRSFPRTRHMIYSKTDCFIDIFKGIPPARVRRHTPIP
jgi:sorting nexin-1/2